MKVQAEISLYPLRTVDLSRPIERFCRVLTESGIDVSSGSMSTVMSGNADSVFDAARKAFQAVSKDGEVVMTMKISNACPECEGMR